MPAFIVAFFAFCLFCCSFLFFLFIRILPFVIIIGVLWFAADYFELADALTDWRQSLPKVEVVE